MRRRREAKEEIYFYYFEFICHMREVKSEIFLSVI